MPEQIKVGDMITRWLAGTIEMQLRVTAITDDRIICGEWEFDKATGAEIDEFLGWGPPPKYPMTGSFIKMPGMNYTAISDEEALSHYPKGND